MELPKNRSRRPVTPEDDPFLLALFATTHSSELAGLAWTAEQRDALLAMQFRAQQAHYLQHLMNVELSLLVENEEPIGSLYLARQSNELRIVDIALLPAWRNRGVGTSILREIQDEARAKQLPVVLHVISSNPAQRLYARLGFQIEAVEGLHIRMVWRP